MALTTALRPHRIRRLHWQTLIKAVEFAQLSLDDPQVLVAASRFFRRKVASGRDIESLLVASDSEVHFIPWVLWDAEIGRSGGLGKVLVSKARHKETREILRALVACRPEVWRIDAVEGERASLRRLRDDAVATLADPILSCGVAVGELLVARIADLGDVQILDAVHEALPGRHEPAMRRAAKRIAKLPAEAQLLHLRRAAFFCVTGPDPVDHRRTHLPRTVVTSLVFSVANMDQLLAVLQRCAVGGLVQAVSPKHYRFAQASIDLRDCELALRRGRLHATIADAAQCAKLRVFVEEQFADAVAYAVTVHERKARVVRDAAIG